MNHLKMPIVAHLVDYLSPESIPWFQILIRKLNVKNYLFPQVIINQDKIQMNNTEIIAIKSIDFKTLPFLRKILNTINRIYRYNKLKFWLTKNKIQLIHAHFAHVGWETLKLKETLKLPLIISFYGYDYQSVPFKYPIWKKRYQNLFEKVDKIICEGNNGKKILTEMGCKASKIEVCNLGIETEKIPMKERNKKENSLRLVQIANMVDKKGHIYTIKAFSLALKNCPEMHLTLIGSGKNKTQIIQLIHDEGISQNVTIIERIDYSKLHDILYNFDIFIHPSCYTEDMDCEGGAPIVLLDAQATGLPIISTYHCDIPDEVIHNQTGLLASEKNIAELSSHISRFYFMSQIDYNTFSINARMHVEEKFNINKNANNFINIYQALL
jgi:colanic acid/amylovoran biosynthesis glycosyltransferase